MCDKLEIEEIGEGGWKVNGWAKVKREFESVFRTISMQGYSLFFISHSKEKAIKKPDGSEYIKITPTLGAAYLGIIENMADIYGYASSYKQENGENKVLLTVRAPAEEICTGSHFKYIEPRFDFNYESLVNAINDAIEKEARLTNYNFITTEKNQNKEVEELNFDELLDDVNMIIKQLISKNTEEDFQKKISPKIIEIAEKYLGKGKKINQCKRNQTEQLLLIKDDLLLLLEAA